MLVPVKIGWINWESDDLELIAKGDYSLIYRLLPGLIAKVGWIDQEEVDAQRYVAAAGKALPVLDYTSSTEVSAQVRKAFCGKHGIRPVVSTICTCSSRLDVLLMPEAMTVKPHTYTKKALRAFRNDIAALCANELKRLWENRPWHVAIYQDHLVALDFGDPEREDW